MQEIEEQATISWGSNKRAVAAWDFMRVVIPGVVVPAAMATTFSRDVTGTTETMDLGYADPVEGFIYTKRGDR